MQLKHTNSKTLKKAIANIVAQYLDLEQYHLFVFGSRVTGRGDDHSDIDIGIQGPTVIPSSIFLDIRETIENLPYLYKIDIVDFQRVSPEFKETALQHTEEIKLS